MTPRAGLPAAGPLRRWGRVGVWVVVVMALLLPAMAQDTGDDESRFGAESVSPEEGWTPWPLVHWQTSKGARMVGLHPLYSRFESVEPEERVDSHLLWPLYTRTWRKRAPLWHDQYTTRIFYIWFSRRGVKVDQRESHRFLFPLYWHGWQQDGGRYFVLFPFVWTARDADVVIPIFPPRRQSFTAVWPFYGDFRGFWTRDRIRWWLWPLLVFSEKEEEDGWRLTQTSVLWPIFSIFRGSPGTGGFRVWPLGAYVQRPGVFRRGYWLWPLGHYRREAVGPGGGPREVVLFVPFYGRIRQQNMAFDMLFPFYGKLDMRGRTTRGYLAAIYNTDDNRRSGIRSHRLFWFLVRWTTSIPRDESLTPWSGPLDGVRGGGVFPIYLNHYTSSRRATTVLWPFIHHRVTRSDNSRFQRFYIFPIVGDQRHAYDDGSLTRRIFYFPFYREWRDRDGRTMRNVPHLWFYSRSTEVDRNYAPLWSLWRQTHDPADRTTRTRVLGPVWQHDRSWLGVRRRKLDLGVFSAERIDGPQRPVESRTRLLWGLADYQRFGGRRTVRILGLRVAGPPDLADPEQRG